MYIALDFQQAIEYWQAHISAIRFSDSTGDQEEATMLFDAWIRWLTGAELLDGTDVQYLYALEETVCQRLDLFGLEYRIIDEEGNDVRPQQRGQER